MDKDYVEKLSRPNANEEFVKKEAKELITDYIFSNDIIEYAIDNFLQAESAYRDDFDPQKLYYKIQLQDKTRNICFDIENLAHLLGLPNSRYLLKATIINEKITTRVDSRNWLNVFKTIFTNEKKDIVEYDSNPDNAEEFKLNWDKIAEKVYCFLNIGILSEGETIYYRQNVSTKDVKNYLLVRHVVSDGINGQIRIQLTVSKVGNEEILTPVSIMYNDNTQKMKKITYLDKDYIFAGIATIEQKMGGNYGK